MKSRYFLKFILSNLGIASLIFTQSIWGSSFQLFEQDESDLGNNHAGSAATGDSAATEYTNPAAMTLLKALSISLGGVLINPTVYFKGSVLNDQTIVSGSTMGAIPVPNFHIAGPLTDKISAGFGITVPFGLQTDWGVNDMISFGTTLTAIKTINVGPSIAYAINDKFSVGIGFDAQYVQGEFDQFSLNPDLAGMSVINKAQGWGYGYNLGVLYQFNPGTRAGLTYRSSIRVTPSGTSQTVLAAQGDQPEMHNTSHISTNTLSLPASVTLSAYHDLNKLWTFLGTVTWTQWTSIKNLMLINVANPITPGQTLPPIVLPQNYHDTINVAMGANYHLTQKSFLRFGVGYDQSPTNDINRDLRLPDSDRIVGAFGWHYQPYTKLGIDVGYSHIFALATSINTKVDTGTGLFVPEQGRVYGSADLIGMQINYAF